jgi:hypothetical protein
MPTRMTQDEFIGRAIQVHGARYDYSKTTWAIKREPITVICREYGRIHLNAKGPSPRERLSGIQSA